MTEAEPFVSRDRINVLRTAVRAAQALGIEDKATRREVVIDAKGAQRKELVQLRDEVVEEFPSIANPSINQEPPEVVERALNKYLEVKVGDPKVPVLVDAVHAVAPNATETRLILQEIGIVASYEEVSAMIARVQKKEDDGSELYQAVRDIRNKSLDSYTGTMAQSLAEKTGASLIVAKQSQARSDLNRYWYHRDQHNGFLSREYPRSGRAALYWGIKSVLEATQRLNEENLLTTQFVRLSLHGMRDRSFDFAIGGLEGIADQAVIIQFKEELQKALFERQITIGDKTPEVIIATPDQKKTSLIYGSPSLPQFRSSRSSYSHFPPFGLNFHTIQLEMSARMRGKDYRDRVVDALAQVIFTFKSDL